MSRFKDRVAVVTGGTQGLGREYVDAFHREGSRVAILDINDPSPTIAEYHGAPQLASKSMSRIGPPFNKLYKGS